MADAKNTEKAAAEEREPQIGDGSHMWAIFKTPRTGPVNIHEGDAVALHKMDWMAVTNDPARLVSFPDIRGQALSSSTENGAPIRVRMRGLCVFRYDPLAGVPRLGEWIDRAENDALEMRGAVERRTRPGPGSGAQVLAVNQKEKTVVVYM